LIGSRCDHMAYSRNNRAEQGSQRFRKIRQMIAEALFNFVGKEVKGLSCSAGLICKNFLILTGPF
jgi:hypothetical protein